jgi:hypothetical protein
MALTHQIALVPEGVSIKPSELTRVASALSKQAARDFGPIWNIQANIDPFATLDDVPSDYWPIIINRKVEGAAGFHDDENGQPFALVEFDADWSLTASHECLEMLADPFGRRLRAGNVPPQAVKLGLPNRRVRFLVEVCDPSEGAAFSYHVNGVLVSDFYTPDYFDPVTVSSVRYSFTGAVTAPRTVLNDGYISWHDPVTGRCEASRPDSPETQGGARAPHGRTGQRTQAWRESECVCRASDARDTQEGVAVSGSFFANA